MANRKAGKRGSGIIALIAVIAAIAGPPTASADPGNAQAPAKASLPATMTVESAFPFLDASWAEE